MQQRMGLQLVNAVRWGRSLGRHLSVRAVLVAGLGVVAPAAGHASEPMRFSVTQLGVETNGACGRGCADVITAEGEINNETADDFVAFLSSHVQQQDLRPVVLIQSPGGTVVGAMQLGMAFRKIGAEVVVGEAVQVRGTDRIGLAPGLCMSACVYAFFGGTERVVPSISRLGIHRMVINEAFRDPAGGYERQQTFGTNDIVSSLAAYTRMMGIDPDVIRYAETVAPESIHIVTQREIARWRLARAHL